MLSKCSKIRGGRGKDGFSLELLIVLIPQIFPFAAFYCPLGSPQNLMFVRPSVCHASRSTCVFARIDNLSRKREKFCF